MKRQLTKYSSVAHFRKEGLNLLGSMFQIKLLLFQFTNKIKDFVI